MSGTQPNVNDGGMLGAEFEGGFNLSSTRKVDRNEQLRH